MREFRGIRRVGSTLQVSFGRTISDKRVIAKYTFSFGSLRWLSSVYSAKMLFLIISSLSLNDLDTFWEIAEREFNFYDRKDWYSYAKMTRLNDYLDALKKTKKVKKV